MKFHSDTADAGLRISSYGDGYVCVLERRIDVCFALHDQAVHTFDEPIRVADLDWPALVCLHDSPPEILILGTGATQVFPDSSLYAELASRRIGLEVMSTPAACRTYNILRSEGRIVAAVMLPPILQSEG